MLDEINETTNIISDNTDYYTVSMQIDDLILGISNTYAFLQQFDDTMISIELSDLCESASNLRTVLNNPKEHVSEIMLLAKMLNTPQNEVVETNRKQLLDSLLELAEINDFPNADVLLPPPYKKDLIHSLMMFYYSNDINDMRNMNEGWGQHDGVGLTKDNELDYRNLDIDPIFRDLHAIVNNENCAGLIRKDADSLINELHEYYDDPIPDSLMIAYAEPMKDIAFVTIENSIEGIRTLLPNTELACKDLGNGMVAFIDKNGKSAEKPKCRRLFLANGKRGVARGKLIILAIDYKGNFVPFDSNQMMIISELYKAKQEFEETGMPLSNEKAQQVLKTIVTYFSTDDDLLEMLYACGLNKIEIQKYKRLDI